MDAELFNELKDSIRQMKAIEKGDLAPARVRVVNPGNVVAQARMQLGMTQEAFAKLLKRPSGQFAVGSRDGVNRRRVPGF